MPPSERPAPLPLHIVSGGQTGADRAALDAAIRLDLPHGGWVPEGRLAEDGRIPDRYQVKELPGAGYQERTERNVIDSHGTLIVSHGPLTGGSKLTRQFAEKHGRPILHLDLDEISIDAGAERIKDWLSTNTILVLNVAGPRASGDPLVYPAVIDLLISAFDRE
ncbi:putative molybdenum carrier protein [Thermodesulfobacteriota bacterium]